MSNHSEGTLFSSATYINDKDETKSNKTKLMLPVVNTDKLGMKIRVIKTMIDLRFLMRKWFINIFVMTVIIMLLVIILNLIPFYFLYMKDVYCDLEDTYATVDPDNDGNRPTPNDDQDETQTKRRGTGRNNDMWFWTGQVFSKIDDSSKDVKQHVSNSIGHILRGLESKLEDLLDQQVTRVKNFYLELSHADRVRFEAQKGGRVTVTSRKKPGTRPRKPKTPDQPRNPRPPPNPPRTPKPRPTSVWIGPPGAPGEMLKADLKSQHNQQPATMKGPVGIRKWISLAVSTKNNNHTDQKSLAVTRTMTCPTRRLFTYVGLDQICPAE